MNFMFAVLGMGGWEMVLILAIVILLFGARKLPDLAKGLGLGIKEFKKASKEEPEKLPASAPDTHKQV
ncbi:MAG TPA: twin-arginine translocase TatA/TatE family subunit [Verrucomicrobiae bacterium]|nr:twin-arginine translocase TatA/TatE family subunit [Verrucomicrobiae bacterium]